jgi:dienelactone hydrolase
MADHDLAGFARGTFTHGGTTKDVLRCGEGPAVIVMTEMPGISPRVLEFAQRVADIGCTAVLPVLFGVAGRDPIPARDNPLAIFRGTATIAQACISREFTVWATGKSSPIITWLRALAAAEHERCGGPGVGAIGMCFTGGFALAMAADERILAPVLSQPSLPFGVTPAQRNSIDISPAELDAVKHRCANGLRVVGMRFKGDRFVPAGRFAFLRRELGDAFVAVELEDDDANPAGVMPPHSVVTEHLVDEPGTPTRAALDLVLDLFRERLLAPAPA